MNTPDMRQNVSSSCLTVVSISPCNRSKTFSRSLFVKRADCFILSSLVSSMASFTCLLHCSFLRLKKLRKRFKRSWCSGWNWTSCLDYRETSQIKGDKYHVFYRLIIIV
ncbi:hypothetical protein FGO68_gene6093 [Halteria grandinella]|uniref:Uncharacterized protein n=1 Tax=Halteria grandinella TaxID=5974 RepID=A0A8J8NYV6_HALGN|nr:hypothetical protein FGO68_gene6093 [Halteria grandinella]